MRADKVPTMEMLRRIRAGEVDGLPATDMPRSSFMSRLRRIDREAEPSHGITPENELDQAAELERRLLALCKEQAAKLERAASRGVLDPRQMSSLTKLTKTVADIKQRAAKREQLASSPSSPHRASAAATESPRETLIRRLERAERNGSE